MAAVGCHNVDNALADFSSDNRQLVHRQPAKIRR
jgi:hypothetical protein